MGNESLVFVDIETNGGNGDRGRIIEVAAIKVENGSIVDSFQSLINPGTAIPYWITKLTGISESDVAHAPYFESIANRLHSFLQNSVFVAHNVLFDYSFLKREFKQSGLPFTPKLLCTVKLSRALFPEHKGHSLQKIIERHNITVADRHRAYDDALAIYAFTKIARETKGEEAFERNILLQLKTKSLPPNVEAATILALPETPGVYVFEDDNGMPLYVGKSINIRSRVRSHFTNATSIAKEMKMSLQSHNITYMSTETEIEALLLESAKIKELQPVYNRKLRRKKTQHILVRHQTGDYLSFSIESHDLSAFTNLSDVYGVFSTKNQAKQKLEEIVRLYQLCPKLMGLEHSKGVCFRYQLGACKGACGGEEGPDTYNRRVEFALEQTKIETWPYPSRVGIAISPTRTLVIDQWIPQGIYDAEVDGYSEVINTFDLDTYKIIRSYLRLHKPKVTLFTADMHESWG